MVTKEEFEHFISEVESFRDLMMEEITKIKNDMEVLKETVEDIARETKVNLNKKIG